MVLFICLKCTIIGACLLVTITENSEVPKECPWGVNTPDWKEYKEADD